MESLKVLEKIKKREKPADYLIWAIFILIALILITNVFGYFFGRLVYFLNIIFVLAIAYIFFRFWSLYYKRFKR